MLFAIAWNQMLIDSAACY